MNVFIIGSGNIASHFSLAFKKNNIDIVGIDARNDEQGYQIAQKANAPLYESLKTIPKNADVYLICVSDDAIKTVVEQLPKSIRKSKIIAHTSGNKSISDTLSTCKNGGVFYPLQTFTKGKKMSYKSIPFCINGTNAKTLKKLTEFANSISNSVQIINDEQRKSIHLSAVIINNFVNHLIYASEELLKLENVDPSILQPLLQETIRKQIDLGAFHAQTGPARRLDAETLSSHLDLLKSHKDFKAMYTTISKSIQKTYKKK